MTDTMIVAAVWAYSRTDCNRYSDREAQQQYSPPHNGSGTARDAGKRKDRQAG